MSPLVCAVVAFWDLGQIPPLPEPPTHEEAWEILRTVLGVIIGFCVLDSLVISPLLRRDEKRREKERRARSAVDPYDLESVCVYRLFDNYGFLLYVGIAADPKARFGQHSKEKPWWPDVATWEVAWFRDRASAAAEEARAIVEEAPAYNLAGSPDARKSDGLSVQKVVADIDGFQRVKAGHLDYLFVHYMASRAIPDHAPRPFWLHDHITTVYWHAHDRAGPVARGCHYGFVRRWEQEHDKTAAVTEKRRRRADAASAARKVLGERTAPGVPRARRAKARKART